MIKAIKTTFVLVSMILMMSCSIHVDLTLINESSAPIKIEYRIKDGNKYLESYGLEPYRKRLNEWKPWRLLKQDGWKKLSVDE